MNNIANHRTVRITMRGGGPWGFRLIGGGTKPLRISKIRRRSKAHEAGLQPGDLLLCVNGVRCERATHEYAMQLILQVIDSLSLELGREAERVLVFHNDIADYEEPEEQNAPERESEPTQLQSAPTEPVQESAQDLIQDQNQENDSSEEVGRVIPASEDVTPVPINKLLKEASPEPAPVGGKKVFADSSFFNDPNKNFPTIEEEKEMAHRVAQALTDARNKASRGASMFEKRRLRSAKWITENDETPGFESPEGTPIPENTVPVNFFGSVPSLYMVPPPPPPPPAPGKNDKLFVEEIKRAPRVTHNDVPPAKCFDIAAALHNSNMGRGAQIFARRRARSDKWVVEAEDADQTPPPQPQAQSYRMSSNRDPVVVARIGGPRQPPSQSQYPAQSSASVQLRTPARPMANANQGMMPQNRYSMVEGGTGRLSDSQTSLAVAKAPPTQNKTFNTQPKGWRPVA